MNVLGVKMGVVEKVVAVIVLFTLVAGLLPVSFAQAETELVDETVLLVDGLPTGSTDSNTAEVSEVIFDTDIDTTDTEVVIISEETDVCENIPEVQSEIPEGYEADGNACYPIEDREAENTIEGHKYECIYDPEAFEGEGGYNCDTPVGGWGITVTNGDVTFSTFTDADGAYSFTVSDGEWEVSEAESDYWQQYYTWENGESIESYTCNFDFRTATEVTRVEDADGYCDFGNVHITYPITGFKWNDANANGVKDEGEAGVAGWKITAYEGDGKATRQVQAITDENGAYTLDLEKGEWTIREEVKNGWKQVAVEQDGEVDREIDSCQFSIIYSDEPIEDTSASGDDCTFYNQYEPVYPVIGQKWNDANANGVRDEGEEGVAGWTIYADNSADDFGPVSVVTGENGEYEFSLVAGNWTITEESRSRWTQTGVVQNGDLLSEGVTTCNFGLGEMLDKKESRSEENTCVFLNHEEPRRSSGGGSGTRVKDRTTPTPQVLGASSSTPACGMYLTDYMRMGKAASSTEVTKLQVFLNAVGVKLEITGMFDAATDVAVRKFQGDHKVEVLTPWYLAKLVPHENPTGWVYQLTRWKINNMVCPGSEAYPVLN